MLTPPSQRNFDWDWETNNFYETVQFDWNQKFYWEAAPPSWGVGDTWWWYMDGAWPGGVFDYDFQERFHAEVSNHTAYFSCSRGIPPLVRLLQIQE